MLSDPGMGERVGKKHSSNHCQLACMHRKTWKSEKETTTGRVKLSLETSQDVSTYYASCICGEMSKASQSDQSLTKLQEHFASKHSIFVARSNYFLIFFVADIPGEVKGQPTSNCTKHSNNKLQQHLIASQTQQAGTLTLTLQTSRRLYPWFRVASYHRF